MRALIAARSPVSQTELARLVGVSQPRVSQVLSRLSAAGAVEATARGYCGRDDQLIGQYLAHHRPALAAPDVPWYSLGPMREQVECVSDYFQSHSIRMAASSDLAPDLLAAWRHPTLTVIYTTEAVELSALGFVPAEGRVDATMLIRHTTDATLLAACEPWPRLVEGIAVVDPVQQIWDLHDLGGEDRVEAALRLRRRVLDRTLTTPP